MATTSYDALIDGKVFFGGAKDVKDMVQVEGVKLVVDLREESEGCAYPEAEVRWVKVPLGDEAHEPQADLFRKAILEVAGAYRDGIKVGFHCGGGRGRTGTVAVGVLMELGMAGSLQEAEAQAKAKRPSIAVKPAQWDALREIYRA